MGRYASILAVFAACTSSTTLDGGVASPCAFASECASGTTCIAGACTTDVACASSRMCPGLVCDGARGVCVECTVDGDCPHTARCQSDVCAPSVMCRSDRECSAMGAVCDVTRALCVECNVSTDCAAAQFCAADHSCMPVVCSAGSTMCVGNALATCFSDGSGFGAPNPCATGACSGGACAPGMDGGVVDAGRDAALDASVDAGPDPDAEVCGPLTDCGAGCVNLMTDHDNCSSCGHACAATEACIGSACVLAGLYHGWACPIAGCVTSGYNTTAATAAGGTYPFNSGDSDACRAWKLAATVCTTAPMFYSDMNNWTCPASGGFTDPTFGTYCSSVGPQYSCSSCPGACNAMCVYHPLSLRNCSGMETMQM